MTKYRTIYLRLDGFEFESNLSARTGTHSMHGSLKGTLPIAAAATGHVSLVSMFFSGYLRPFPRIAEYTRTGDDHTATCRLMYLIFIYFRDNSSLGPGLFDARAL
jgi:hypothetical protein